jgi:hypothetical protein
MRQTSAMTERAFEELIRTARHRRMISYRALGAAIGAHPHRTSSTLAAVMRRLDERGYPNLGALVVHLGTDRVGSGYAGDDVQADREACWRFFADHS